MVFLNPLLAWVAVPLFGMMLYLVWLFQRNYLATNTRYGETRLLQGIRVLSKTRLRLLSLLLIIGSAMVIAAAARPAIRSNNIEFPRGTVDVVAVADVSRSMAAQDYAGKTSAGKLANGTRLDMVREVLVNQLIPSLRSNRLGIVSYAGSPYDQAYLTDDYKALKWVIEDGMTITSAPGEGSCMAQALLLACRYFDVDSANNHERVLVLFSDGGNDDKEEDLQRAIGECMRRGIKVMIVGVGKAQPSAIPVKMLSPNDRFRMTDQTVLRINGETVMTARDEQFLIGLASRMNGRYIRLDNASDFELLPLDFKLEADTRTSYLELYRYPLCIGLVALVLAYAVVRAPRNPLRRGASS